MLLTGKSQDYVRSDLNDRQQQLLSFSSWSHNMFAKEVSVEQVLVETQVRVTVERDLTCNEVSTDNGIQMEDNSLWHVGVAMRSRRSEKSGSPKPGAPSGFVRLNFGRQNQTLTQTNQTSSNSSHKICSCCGAVILNMMFVVSNLMLVLSLFVAATDGTGAKLGVKGLSTLSERPSMTPSRYLPRKKKIGHTTNPAPLASSQVPSDTPSFSPSSTPSYKGLSASDAPSFVPSSLPSCRKRKEAKSKSKNTTKTKGARSKSDYNDHIETTGSKTKAPKSDDKSGKSRKLDECIEEDDMDDNNSTAGQPSVVSGAALSSAKETAAQSNSQTSAASVRTVFATIMTIGMAVTSLAV